jgi:glycosyltransferase involved in cell wall biosynthesis
MSRLLIANVATAVPMGAQVYQEEVASRAPAALGAEWRVDRMVVRSLRSDLAGTRRLPVSRLAGSPAWLRREIGRAAYPRRSVVHRMNLELPPSTYADVITLHDLVAWKYPDESAPVKTAAEEARRAAAVICVSAFTATEAVDRLGITGPYVIPNGVDPCFFDAAPLDGDALGRLGVDGPYVLASGGASERKNLRALAEAWRDIHQARPDLTLVLSGPEHPRRNALFGGLPGVRLVGRVDAAMVPGLMAAASAVVVPSLDEGFGLPALEAMAVGTPLVAAATSSLPEVVGDGGTLVSPDAHGITEGLLHAVSDDISVTEAVRRGRARATEFTWERSAAAHAEIWRTVRAALD